jgi:hypothetical protein
MFSVEHAEQEVVMEQRNRQLRQALVVVDDVARVPPSVVDAHDVARQRTGTDHALADAQRDRKLDHLGRLQLGPVGSDLGQHAALGVDQIDDTVLQSECGDRLGTHRPRRLAGAAGLAQQDDQSGECGFGGGIELARGLGGHDRNDSGSLRRINGTAGGTTGRVRSWLMSVKVDLVSRLGWTGRNPSERLR